jgi:hypothetical protein
MDQDNTLNDILESVSFIKDHAASKDDIANMATKSDLFGLATKDDIADMATKSDLFGLATKDDIADMATRTDMSEMKNEIITHIDGFAAMQQKLDLELGALRMKYERLEGFVKQLAAHAHVTLDY